MPRPASRLPPFSDPGNSEKPRSPGLFEALRGIIDEGRAKGLRTGRFLILGSASLKLPSQSGETLAGRIAFLEMTPLSAVELRDAPPRSLYGQGAVSRKVTFLRRTR